MTQEPEESRSQELRNLLQAVVVPALPADEEEARRARVVRRIEETILAEAERVGRLRRRRRVLGAAALAAALALGLGLAAPRTGEPAAGAAAAPAAEGVRALEGALTVVHGGVRAAVTEATLAANDHVETAPGARAELRLSRLVVAELGEASRMALLAPGPAAHRVRLEAGALHAVVDEAPTQAPKLVVETPDADVVVTGTVLEVQVGGDAGAGTTRVAVSRGHVSIRRGGRSVAEIGPGGSWSSAPPPQPVGGTARAVAPAPSAVAAGGLARPAPAPAPTSALSEQNRLFMEAADARRRGDAPAAADHLAALLARHPASPLGAEAHLARMRSLDGSGRHAEAAEEARNYLRALPEGPAAAEARRIARRSGGGPELPAPTPDR